MSRVGTRSVCRGVNIRYVLPRDVKPGDQLCCWLSDGSAYPTVVGSTSRILQLSRYGLDDVEHVTFTTTGDDPWWTDDMRTFAADVPMPIVDREA
jgi:hypothetical protein